MELLKRTRRDAEDRLFALLAAAEPRIRRRFKRYVSQLQDKWTLDYIASLIEAGRMDDAYRAAQLSATHLVAGVNATYIAAGASTARAIDVAVPVTVDFDQANLRAIATMRENQLRLVRELVEDQRLATQAALNFGVERGLNPREIARDVRNSIGLTARQMSAVNNYRRLLEQNSAEALERELRDRRFDRTVQRAIDSGNVLTRDQVDRMVERYTDRYRDFRAETIARTEALRAVHQGNDEMYRQALDGGLLRRETTVREWIAAGDDRTRDSHAYLHGQKRGIDEPFETEDGILIMYPGDPNAPASETIQCRCSVTTRITSVAEVIS